jgi:hypothetical protein
MPLLFKFFPSFGGGDPSYGMFLSGSRHVTSKRKTPAHVVAGAALTLRVLKSYSLPQSSFFTSESKGSPVAGKEGNPTGSTLKAASSSYALPLSPLNTGVILTSARAMILFYLWHVKVFLLSAPLKILRLIIQGVLINMDDNGFRVGFWPVKMQSPGSSEEIHHSGKQ